MKVPVARRNLLSDKTRLAISIAGVAVAILLILTLLAVYKGSVDQAAAYVSHVDADVWVGQAGTHDMFHTFSLVPTSLVGELSSIEGVSEAHPLVSRTTSIPIDGKENSINVIGYHPANGAGGPFEIAEGRGDPQPGEIIADKVTMKTNGLHLGDSIDIEGKPHEIIGVSQGTSVLVSQYAFVDIEETRAFLGPDRANFILLKAAGPGTAEQLKQRIEELYPGLAVFTKSDFAFNNSAVIRNSFLPILAVLVVIAFIIGVAIVGLVVYSATLERKREYGILKAIGATRRQLYMIVFKQAVLSSIAGYLVGLLLAFGVIWLVGQIVAQISMAFSWTHFLAAFVSALAMSFLASYVPARKVNRIDPVVVFKA